MAGTYEKPTTISKWRRSLSNVLPGLANRIMPPTNISENATHLPVYAISGSGISSLSDPNTKVVMATPEVAPKSPTFSVNSFEGFVCRICHDVKDVTGKKKLISPCGCTGSAQYIHKQCLQKWTKLKGASTCEICHQSYEKKYIKFKMTSSEENTVASAITILLLLVGVLSVGIYLLAEYLVKVSRDPEVRRTNEIWVSISLVFIGVLGMLVFLPWFICFCARSGKTPRALSTDGRSASNSTSGASISSSMADLSGGNVVENAHLAYEQSLTSSDDAVNETDDVFTPAQTTDAESSAQVSETGAYVNQVVRVDGLEEDNIYARDNPAVLFV